MNYNSLFVVQCSWFILKWIWLDFLWYQYLCLRSILLAFWSLDENKNLLLNKMNHVSFAYFTSHIYHKNKSASADFPILVSAQLHRCKKLMKHEIVFMLYSIKGSSCKTVTLQGYSIFNANYTSYSFLFKIRYMKKGYIKDQIQKLR